MPRCAWARTIAPGPFRNEERLLRYCARPTFALERLELIDEQQVIDRLPRTQRNGTTALSLTPLEPLVCPNCGADMRIIAFVTEAAPVQRILAPIGEPTEPPPIAPARGPPAWDDDLGPTPDWDLIAQPDPAFELDQPVSWSPPSAATEGAAAPDLPPARCACTLLPNPGRCVLRHLRDVRAAFGWPLTSLLALASLSSCRRLGLAEALAFPIRKTLPTRIGVRGSSTVPSQQ